MKGTLTILCYTLFLIALCVECRDRDDWWHPFCGKGNCYSILGCEDIDCSVNILLSSQYFPTDAFSSCLVGCSCAQWTYFPAVSGRLEQNATLQEVKKAYRNASLTLHPVRSFMYHLQLLQMVAAFVDCHSSAESF
jgi:hypothetical protein